MMAVVLSGLLFWTYPVFTGTNEKMFRYKIAWGNTNWGLTRAKPKYNCADNDILRISPILTAVALLSKLL